MSNTNNKVHEIVDKHMSKYSDTAIIIQMAVSQMVSSGMKYYADLTPEQMVQIVEDQQKPIPDEVKVNENGKEYTVKHIKLTSKELDRDILEMQHELAQLSVTDIEDLIAYINREAIIDRQQLLTIIDNMRNMLLEKGISDKEILTQLRLEEDEFTELTGLEMNVDE